MSNVTRHIHEVCQHFYKKHRLGESERYMRSNGVIQLWKFKSEGKILVEISAKLNHSKKSISQILSKSDCLKAKHGVVSFVQPENEVVEEFLNWHLHKQRLLVLLQMNQDFQCQRNIFVDE